LKRLDLDGRESGDEQVAAHGGCGEGEKLLPIGRGDLADSLRVVEKGFGGVHICEEPEAGWFQGFGALVEVVGVADLAGRDECKRAVDLGGDPGGVMASVQVVAVIELRKDLGVGGTGVEQVKVLRKLLLGFGKILLVVLKDVEVGGDLLIDVLAGFAGLAEMVEVLDGLFEAHGDDEAEDDGGDVDEEVAPGLGGVVGGMDVEHGGGLRDGFGRVGWGWHDCRCFARR